MICLRCFWGKFWRLRSAQFYWPGSSASDKFTAIYHLKHLKLFVVALGKASSLLSEFGCLSSADRSRMVVKKKQRLLRIFKAPQRRPKKSLVVLINRFHPYLWFSVLFTLSPITRTHRWPTLKPEKVYFYLNLILFKKPFVWLERAYKTLAIGVPSNMVS